MPASRLVEAFFDGADFNFGANYGPISIDGPLKLFEINFRGAIDFEQTNYTAGDNLGDSVLFGLQNGAAGYSPLPINTNLNSNQFFIAQAHVPSEIVVVNSPATNTAGVEAGGGIDLTWRGQLALEDDTDFYFTTGLSASGYAAWAIDGTLTVWYTST